MNLLLEKVTLKDVGNSCESLLIQSPPDNVKMDNSIINIFYENPLIKFHSKKLPGTSHLTISQGESQTSPSQKWNGCPYLSGSATTLIRNMMGVNYFFLKEISFEKWHISVVP